MVKINEKLSDENDKAVTKTIKLLINNGRKTIKTDNTGTFTYSHNATWAGQNTITATYLESNNYLPTNSTTTFTVTKTEAVNFYRLKPFFSFLSVQSII